MSGSRLRVTVELIEADNGGDAHSMLVEFFDEQRGRKTVGEWGRGESLECSVKFDHAGQVTLRVTGKGFS